jgi:hypothetical protein
MLLEVQQDCIAQRKRADAMRALADLLRDRLDVAVQRAWRSDQYRNWWLEEKATRELAEARAQAEQQRRKAAEARVRELETVLMKYVKVDPCDQPGIAETELYKEAFCLLFPFLSVSAPQERGGEGMCSHGTPIGDYCEDCEIFKAGGKNWASQEPQAGGKEEQ